MSAFARKLRDDIGHRHIALRCLAGKRIFRHLTFPHVELRADISLQLPVRRGSRRPRPERDRRLRVLKRRRPRKTRRKTNDRAQKKSRSAPKPRGLTTFFARHSREKRK